MRKLVGTLIVVLSIISTSTNTMMLILCFYVDRLYREHWTTVLQCIASYWGVLAVPILCIIPGVFLIVTKESKRNETLYGRRMGS